MYVRTASRRYTALPAPVCEGEARGRPSRNARFRSQIPLAGDVSFAGFFAELFPNSPLTVWKRLSSIWQKRITPCTAAVCRFLISLAPGNSSAGARIPSAEIPSSSRYRASRAAARNNSPPPSDVSHASMSRYGASRNRNERKKAIKPRAYSDIIE